MVILKTESDELKIITKELESWKNNDQIGGDKEVAAQRILDAFKNKNSSLDLSGLGLKTLPDCFHHLHELKMVNLSDNRLTYLPPSLLKNSFLRELNIIGNTYRLLALKFPK